MPQICGQKEHKFLWGEGVKKYVSVIYGRPKTDSQINPPAKKQLVPIRRSSDFNGRGEIC